MAKKKTFSKKGNKASETRVVENYIDVNAL